jgi:hypothetical protein
MRAEWVPTTPPPMTTTRAGGTPDHAAQQQALPAGRLAQRERGRLDRQTARHFAHRCQQRQPAAVIGHRFVGDGRAARFQQPVRLLRVGREVQVGEEDLALAQHLPFGGLRLLDLHDHLGGREHLGRRRHDARAGREVGRIVGADADTGTRLDQHLVTLRGVLADRHRRQADTVFLDLDLLRYTHAHGRLRDRLESTQSKKRVAAFAEVLAAGFPEAAMQSGGKLALSPNNSLLQPLRRRCQALGRVKVWMP